MKQTKKTVIDNIIDRNKDNLNLYAFEGMGVKTTYKQFFEEVEKYAKAYKELGIVEDDVVTLCLAGTLDTIIHFYALNKIGAVANFVNPNFIKYDSERYIDKTNSKIVVIADKFYTKLKDSLSKSHMERIILSTLTEYASPIYKLAVRPEKIDEKGLIKGIKYTTLKEFRKLGTTSQIVLTDLEYKESRNAAITYTSGTTGNPKGVVLTNDGLNNMISIYDLKDGFGSKKGDKNLLLIPPMYGTSLCHSINTPLAFGCLTQLQPLYNPQNFYKDLRKFKPNIVVASKAHYISLLEATKAKTSSLKFVNMAFSGGEPITSDLAKDINSKLNMLGTGALIIGYGMSEFGTMVMFNMDIPDRINESGHLMPEMQARIINPLTKEIVKQGEKGILEVYTPCAMKEYYGDQEKTENFFRTDEDGKKWGNTGDIAIQRENGVYEVLGRAKDSFVNENNEIVYLFEIENLIESIKYVRECEVVAITINGKTTPVAHIILKQEYKSLTSKILQYIDSYLKEHLDYTAVPYAYKFRDSFDTSPISGKRDYESLKYETEGFIIVTEERLETIKIESEESQNISSFITEVKKQEFKL